MDIEVSRKDIDRIETLLDGMEKGALTVLGKAVNRTIEGVKIDMRRQAQRGTRLKAREVALSIKISKATAHHLDLVAKAWARPRHIPLHRYAGQPTRPGGRRPKTGASAELPDQGRVIEPGSFVIRSSVTDQTEIMLRGKNRRMDYRGKPRLPLQILCGPSVAELLAGRDGAMRKIEANAQETLNRRVEYEFDQFLKRSTR